MGGPITSISPLPNGTPFTPPSSATCHTHACESAHIDGHITESSSHESAAMTTGRQLNTAVTEACLRFVQSACSMLQAEAQAQAQV